MRRRDFIALAGLGMSSALASCRSLPVFAQAEDVVDGVAPGFERLRDIFLTSHSDDPGGAQFVVYRHGQRIIDLCTGTDPVKNRPFAADSITTVMSATKGWTAIVALDLVERGVLELDAPVAHYWPEFAVNGKANIPVEWLLSHRAGLPNFPREAGILWPEMANWDRCIRVLEQAEPAWTPGSAVQYHAVTQGFLVGEVVRRASGRTVGRHIAEEYALPLQLDLWIGNLPESAEQRYAPQFRLPLDAPPTSVDFLNTRAAHTSEIPAANGIANARSMAKLYAATIGEVDGIRILRDETIQLASRDATAGLNAPDGTIRTARYGLGFNLWGPAGLPMLGPGSFGHAGAGGRIGLAHPPSGTAVAYICNHMAWDSSQGPDPRWACIAELKKLIEA